MTKYISNPENLKLMMNMLKDKSRNIQFEAFHVFKVGEFNASKVACNMMLLISSSNLRDSPPASKCVLHTCIPTFIPFPFLKRNFGFLVFAQAL